MFFPDEKYKSNYSYYFLIFSISLRDFLFAFLYYLNFSTFFFISKMRKKCGIMQKSGDLRCGLLHLNILSRSIVVFEGTKTLRGQRQSRVKLLAYIEKKIVILLQEIKNFKRSQFEPSKVSSILFQGYFTE